jgi:hypothetical protein
LTISGSTSFLNHPNVLPCIDEFSIKYHYRITTYSLFIVTSIIILFKFFINTFQLLITQENQFNYKQIHDSFNSYQFYTILYNLQFL